MHLIIFCCLVIQEVSPHVIITSAKQERCMTRFLRQLGEFWEIKIILAWEGESFVLSGKRQVVSGSRELNEIRDV